MLGSRETAPEGPQQVIPFSLDIVIPLPPLRFMLVVGNCDMSNNQRRKIPWVPPPPPCPQLSSLKNGIDSLHPKTVEKLSVFRGEGEQAEPKKETEVSMAP